MRILPLRVWDTPHRELSTAADARAVAYHVWKSMNVQSCGIFLVCEDAPDFISCFAYCHDSQSNEPFIGSSPALRLEIHDRAGGGLTGHLAHRLKHENILGLILNAEDLTSTPFRRDPPSVAHLSPHGCYTLMVIALRSRKNRFLGFLKIENKKIDGVPNSMGSFGERDERAAQLEARGIERNLETNLLVQQIQRVMMAVQGAQPLTAITATLVQSALAVVGAERGDLILYDDTEQRLRIHASVGHHSHPDWRIGAFVPEVSFLNQMWRKKLPFAKLDDTTSLVEGTQYFEAEPNVRSELAVVIHFCRRPVGILNVDSFETAAFNEEDIHWLRLLEPIAGIAAALAAQSSDYWNTVRNIEIGSSQTDVFRTILAQCILQLKLDAGLLYVWNPVSERLECCASFGADDLADVDPHALTFPRGDTSLACLSFTTGEAQYSPNPRSDPRVWQEGVKRFDIKSSLLAVPLTFGENVLGVMVVWSRQDIVLSEEEIRPISIYASLAAWELRHAELRSFQDQLPVFVLRKRFDESRKEFVLCDANKAYCELHHWKREDILAKSDTELFPSHPAIIAKYIADDREVFETGNTLDDGEFHPLENGEVLYVQIRKTRLLEFDGSYSILCVFWEAAVQDLRAADFELKKIQDGINECQSLEQLYTFCVTELPASTLFRAKYASIFVFSQCGKIRPGTKRTLVLRRTNHPGLQQKDAGQPCVYLLSEPPLDEGLTSWIARHNRSILLNDMQDESSLDKQLQSYGPATSLRHSSTHCDSDPPHSTFLGVPISLGGVGGGGEVLGVLRFTQKISDAHAQGNTAKFTPEENIRLEHIAAEYIAPKLIALLQAEYQGKLSDFESRISTPEMLDLMNTDKNLTGWIGQTLTTLFPSQGGIARRWHWYDQPIDDEGIFLRRPFDTTHEENGNPFAEGEQRGSLRNSIAEAVTKSENRSIFFAAAHSGLAMPPDAECFLASRVMHEERAVLILCVSSTRFDIDQQHDSLLLELVAGHVSQELLRRTYDPAFSFAMFKHDTLNELSVVESLLQRWALDPGQPKPFDIQRIAVTMTLIARLAQAYELTSLNAFRPYTPRNNYFKLYDILNLIRDRRVLGAIADEAKFDFPNINISVNADPNILTSILYNLIKNSLVHGRDKHGKAEITLRVSMANQVLTMLVADTGPGLSDEDVRRHVGFNITSTFEERWHSSSAREHQLGLPYVAFMVRFWKIGPNRGKIQYLKNLDDPERISAGACFKICLPVFKDDSEHYQ